MNSEKGFVGYEYTEVSVKREQQALYADAYPNFGYEQEGTQIGIGQVNTVTMRFKRDRKIRNKAELTRLQRQFDACAAEITNLEFSKTLAASAVTYVIGVIGCAFMAGSVFAVMAENVLLCVILAIPGFAGWVLPYLIYRLIRRNKVAQITPLIDKKYDEIYSVCEKAHALLDA